MASDGLEPRVYEYSRRSPAPKLTGIGLLQRFSNVDIAPLKPTEGLEWGTAALGAEVDSGRIAGGVAPLCSGGVRWWRDHRRVSAMKSSWQSESGHLACRWSEVGQRVQYNPATRCKRLQTFRPRATWRLLQFLPVRVHLGEPRGSNPSPRLGFQIALWIESRPTIDTEETQVPILRSG